MTFIVLAGFTILFYQLLQNKKEQMTGGKYIESKHLNKQHTINNVKYPPCFEICGASRTIYDILTKYNLVNKYIDLINAQSMALCQEIHSNIKPCDQTMILVRLNESDKLLKGLRNIDAIDIVKSYTFQGNDTIIQFLENITTILENQIQLIKFDNTISDEDKEIIKNMNNTFYQVHYPILTKNCP